MRLFLWAAASPQKKLKSADAPIQKYPYSVIPTVKMVSKKFSAEFEKARAAALEETRQGIAEAEKDKRYGRVPLAMFRADEAVMMAMTAEEFQMLTAEDYESRGDKDHAKMIADLIGEEFHWTAVLKAEKEEKESEVETEAEEEPATKEKKRKEYEETKKLLEKEKELQKSADKAFDAAHDALVLAKEMLKAAQKAFDAAQDAALDVRDRVDAAQWRLNELWGDM